MLDLIVKCHFLEHDVIKELAFLKGILQNIKAILQNINMTEREDNWVKKKSLPIKKIKIKSLLYFLNCGIAIK